MDSLQLPSKIFSKEVRSIFVTNIMVREVKILDQFGSSYDKSISKFNTANSICGYVICAVAPTFAKRLTSEPKPSQVEALLKELNDPCLIVPEVEKSMEFIKHQRDSYIKTFTNDFKTDRERKNYVKDWVANYEISDYIQKNFQLENIFCYA